MKEVLIIVKLVILYIWDLYFDSALLMKELKCNNHYRMWTVWRLRGLQRKEAEGTPTQIITSLIILLIHHTFSASSSIIWMYYWVDFPHYRQ